MGAVFCSVGVWCGVVACGRMWSLGTLNPKPQTLNNIGLAWGLSCRPHGCCRFLAAVAAPKVRAWPEDVSFFS